MIEIATSLSIEDSSSVDTNLQHAETYSNGAAGDSTTKLHQLAEFCTPTQEDNIKETTGVGHSYTKKLYHMILFVCVTLFVLGIIQVPVTLYATSPSSEGSTNAIFDLVDFEDCSIDLEIQEEMVLYNMVTEMCPFESVGVFNNCSDIQASAVTALGYVFILGDMLNSRSCVEDGKSFFCNSIPVLCGNDSGSFVLTEQCLQVRDNDCAVEWRIEETLLSNFSIPDCSSFDSGANLTFSGVVPALTCPDDFNMFCDAVCLPVCGEVSLYNDNITDFYTIWAIVMFVICVAGGVIDFVAYYLKRKTMLKYPLVFTVYASVILLLIDLFITLPYIFGSDPLLCSNDNLVIAIQESTAFCQIQGFVIHAGILVFLMVWFFHVLHMFGGVAFPMKSKSLWESKSFKRKAYVVEIIVILIIGLLPNVIILSVNKYQFIVFPLVCTPSSDPVPVYIFLISNALVCMITLSLLFLTFWMIHKNAQEQNRENKAKDCVGKNGRFSIKNPLRNFSIAEIKLFILFCYYWITMFILLSVISLGVGSSDKLIEDFNTYVSCTAGGNQDECEGIREVIQEDLNDDLVLNLIAYVLVALGTWVILFCVIQVSDIKAIYKRLF